MTLISFSEFSKLSRRYNIIPLYREAPADLETPLSAYMKIDDPEYSFLLESVEGGENIARYSYLGREPFGRAWYKDGKFFKNFKGREDVIRTNDPLGEMQKIFRKYRVAPSSGIPARGGAIGYIGYDIAGLYEKAGPPPKEDGLKWPEMFFMFTDVLMIFDHVSHKIQVVSSVYTDKNDGIKELRNKYNKAVRNINRIIKGLKNPLRLKSKKIKKMPLKIKKHVKKETFKKMVRDTVKLIKNGEAIQVVLSQRFSASYPGDPVEIYRNLRIINPSPYMHFIRFGKKVIIGASPEVMVKAGPGSMALRPIAGTRKRGKNEKEDTMLEKELLSDEKERAEHIMLVDLGRNDVGRVSKTGTVKVKELMKTEKYSHVMHIVSEVSGSLKKNKDAFDAFKASFPAGTVSGAPKVRAMQIINEKEKTKRGPYAGAVGFVSYSGQMNMCISIRTVYYSRGKVYMQAGAGIVADSKPDFEYKETLNKAGAVFNAVKKSLEQDKDL